VPHKECHKECINGLRVKDIADSLSNRRWGLTLLPTEKCNFRCAYCYQNFSAGTMDRITIEAIKKLIECRVNDHELRHFYLNWFGGEPLLAKEIVYEISDHSMRLCKNNECAFRGEIITNGFYLNSDVFRNLLDLGVKKYTTSLDGPKITHNKTRTDACGHGTYDVIYNNIANLKKIPGDFTIMVRLQIYQDNIEHIHQSIDEIAQLFIGDNRFHLTIVPIGRLGGPNDALPNFPSPVKDTQCGEIIKDIYDRFSKYQDIQQFHTTRDKEICHAARMNALTIRANGKIVQCASCLDDPHNEIGMIREDGSMDLSQEKLNWWSKGYQTISHSLLTCPYLKCHL